MSVIFSLFFVPIISGYLFLLHFPFYRHSIKNETGTNLVLLCLICGLAIKVTAYYSGFFSLFDDFTHHTFDIENKDWADIFFQKEDIAAFVLSILIVIFLRVLNLSSRFRDLIERKEYTSNGGPLEKVIEESIRDSRFIMVTLRSRKVYIGMVNELPNMLSEQGQHIKILPIISGYRKETDLKFEQQNEYGFPFAITEGFRNMTTGDVLPIKIDDHDVVEIDYETAKYVSKNFGLIVDSDDIESAVFWMPELYEQQNSFLDEHSLSEESEFKPERIYFPNKRRLNISI